MPHSGKTRTQGDQRQASSQRRRPMSLKGSTGRRESLETTMKVFRWWHTILLRNLTQGQTNWQGPYNVMLSSNFALHTTGEWTVFFREATRAERSLQWLQERWTGEWVNSEDWEARTGRRWFQEPRVPLLQKSLLWTYHYTTLWNILFWPQNTLHMTLKWIIQVCTGLNRKGSTLSQSYIPYRLHSICHLHICWVQKWGKTCFCCSWGHPGGDAGQGTTGSGAVWREDLNCKDRF